MGQLDDLRGPEWRRLLAAARRRLDKTGGEPAGSIGLADPSEDERCLVGRLTGGRAGMGVRRLTVRMTELDQALRHVYGVGLLAVLARLDAPESPAGVAAALQDALRGRHASEGWYAAWLGELSRGGTVARLVRRGNGDLLGRAAAVLDRLPAQEVPLAVLAEWATGDATALSGTPLADLVLRALRLWQGARPEPGRAAERLVWADAGVVVDDLTSQVLVLGLRVQEDHTVARWLDDAASNGLPFRITLHQLMTGPMTPDAGHVFVCQSTEVVRAAAAVLGPDCAPLVCTEGRPSVACRRLLTAATRDGTRVHWRGDFDWAGLRMTAAAIQRYAAAPWRMGAADYREAARESVEPLRGARTTAPWDDRLAAEMAELGRAVREEHLLPVVLADLRLRFAGD